MMPDMSRLTTKTTKEVVLGHLELNGKRVTDIGCGQGRTTRLMTRQGAAVTGIECAAEPLAIAVAKPKAGNETYLEGVGQELPLTDNSSDLCCFFFSLHHVPIEFQYQALEEAHRVLDKGGKVAIFEPVAAGSGFETIRPIDDETIVRAKAMEAIDKSLKGGLFKTRENFTYLENYSYANFEEYKKKVVLVDATRLVAFKKKGKEVLKLFQENGKITKDQSVQFEEPVQFWLLQKL
jgi:ubiquinone/menaquinone biosynthesis C-methylase UbiE